MNSILVIDDDFVDCLINTKILKAGNFAEKVVEHNSGISALKYLESILNEPKEWPSIIFLDINMPTMNGFQFIEAYNQLPDVTERNTKIIILSSSINPKDSEKAKEYEIVSNFLCKPLTFETAEKVLKSTNNSRD